MKKLKRKLSELHQWGLFVVAPTLILATTSTKKPEEPFKKPKRINYFFGIDKDTCNR